MNEITKFVTANQEKIRLGGEVALGIFIIYCLFFDKIEPESFGPGFGLEKGLSSYRPK
jgi:hypothetical protein